MARTVNRGTPGATTTPVKATRAQVARPGAAKAAAQVDAAVEPTPGDVYLQGGVIEVHPDAHPSEGKRLDAGKQTLELLRGERGGLTFGWRVAGDLDAASSLRNYYPSLQLAKAVAEQVPQAFAGVERFVQGVSVPAELTRVRDSAVLGAGASVAGEAAGELGHRDLAPERVTASYWAANPHALELSDASVERLDFGAHWSKELSDNAGLTGDFMIAVARLYARAKELGHGGVGVTDWRAVADSMPDTATGRDVMLRLARAFEVKPAELMFHGLPLSQSRSGRSGAKLEPEAEIGKLNRLGDNGGHGIWSSLTEGDRAGLQLDDSSVRAYYQTWGYSTGVEDLENADDGVALDALRLVTRGAELDLGLQIELVDLQTFVDNHGLTRDDPAAVALVGRALRAFDISPAELELGGSPLEAAAVPAPDRQGQRLGDVHTFARDGGYQNFWNALNRSDPSAHQVDDETLTRMWTQWGLGNDLSGWIHIGSPEFKIGTLNLFARSKELGLNVTCRDLQGALNQLPETPRAAVAARRLAEAMGWDLGDLYLGDTPLSELSAGALRPAPTLPPLTQRPVGRGKLSRNELAAKVQRGDPSAFAIDDSGLAHLTYNWGNGAAAALGPVSADEKWHQGLLKVLARSVDRGVDLISGNLDGYTRSIPPALLADPEFCGRLSGLVRRSRFSAFELYAADGASLMQHPTFVRAAEARLRVEQGAEARVPARRDRDASLPGELGRDAAEDLADYWDNRDPRIFEVRDRALRNEGGDFSDVESMLEDFGDVRVFAFFARAIELMPGCQAQEEARWFLSQGPLTDLAASDEAVPHLQRLAVAAGVSLSDVKVKTQTGVVTLAARIAERRVDLEAALASRTAIAEDLELLDPAAEAHDVERLYAALRLLFEGEPTHELHELVGPLVQARTEGRLEPVDLQAFPENQRAAQLEAALAGWPHLGAAAVLTGLTMKVAAGEVAPRLEAFGYTREQATTWAGYAEKLSSLNGPELGFACADLVPTAERREPDFGTLGLRLELLEGGLTRARLNQARGRLDEPSFVSALLGRIALGGRDVTVERSAALLKELVGKRELDPQVLRALASPAALAELDADTTAQLNRAVADVLHAAPAARPAAEAALLERIRAGSELSSPETLAELALGQLYQADLQKVAPLGEVELEAAAGGEPLRRDAPEAQVADGELHAQRLAVARAPLPDEAGADDNLKRLGTALKDRRPVLLEGPAAANPEALVRHHAASTKAPYLELDLSRIARPRQLLVPPGSRLLQVAAREGALLHLTHAEAAAPEVLDAVANLLDAKRRLTLPGREPHETSPDFRLVVSSTARGPSPAGHLAGLRSVRARSGSNKELVQRLEKLKLKLEPKTLQNLARLHAAVTDEVAVGQLDAEGWAPRALDAERVARRVAAAVKAKSALSEAELLRREVGELYAGRLADGARAHFDALADPLLGALPAEPAPRRAEGSKALTVGDLSFGPTNALSRLVSTPRLDAALYRAAKALSLGEPLALVGPPSSGKSSIAAECARLSGLQSHPVALDAEGGLQALSDAPAKALITVSGVELASPEARAALADASQRLGGRLVVEARSADALGALPLTAVAVPPFEGSGDAVPLAVGLGKRWKVPEPVAETLGRLFDELSAREGSQLGFQQLAGAVQLVAELQGEAGLGAAYLEAVKRSFAGSGDSDAVRKRAIELAE
ncbi:MAG: hypothetical protein IPJ65_07330 [Archangiaceae bacterium]|nr:hypothetical protein [Archangiaceae bacterium]